MSQPFSTTFRARWGEMDFNGHMRNTAYLDLAGHVRMVYFDAHGFSMRRFSELRLGPVSTKDEIEYFRELHLLDEVRVTLALAGLSTHTVRFRLRNEFFDGKGKLAARVTTTGGWFDLTARRLTAPPEELAALVRGLARTDDFQEMPERLRDEAARRAAPEREGAR
jgi:acyl-CoA thioester hydrolase